MKKIKFTQDYNDHQKGDVLRVTQNDAFMYVDEADVAEIVTPDEMVQDTELGETKAMSGAPADTSAGGLENSSSEGDNGSEATRNATDAALDLVEEKGLDLEEVEGTGNDGKVLKSDVEDHLEE